MKHPNDFKKIAKAMTVKHYFGRIVELPFETTEQRLRESLQAEGFGILTEVDVRQTLKKKIDVDFYPYKILGACNPRLAHQVLAEDPTMGVFLPCGVVIRAIDERTTEVLVMNPEAMHHYSTGNGVASAATEVKQRLENALAAL